MIDTYRGIDIGEIYLVRTEEGVMDEMLMRIMG